ncbi:MAG: LON peptidase substrate-binding domain-containing protein, partial [Clostridia bacterium]|nr:LON peptidase substrate-binding domain-containing protein [Clostridia bacterium]
MNEMDFTYLPLLALRGLSCFPSVTLHFEVGRKKSVKALNYAMENGRKIFLVTQKNIMDEDPAADGLYEVGCVARISQVLRMPDDSVKVLVEGLYRARHFDITDKNGKDQTPDDGIDQTDVEWDIIVEELHKLEAANLAYSL